MCDVFRFDSLNNHQVENENKPRKLKSSSVFDGAHCEQILILKLSLVHMASHVRRILFVNNKTKVLTTRKSISGSSSQTLFSAEPVTAGNTSAFAG